MERKVGHNCGGFRTIKEKILNTNPSEKDYSSINLSKFNKRITARVHVLVARAFLNHKYYGREFIVDHKNNIKKDNRSVNLQVISVQQNTSKDKISNSGHTNINYRKNTDNYVVYCTKKGKRLYIGSYKKLEDAIYAYNTES